MKNLDYHAYKNYIKTYYNKNDEQLTEEDFKNFKKNPDEQTRLKKTFFFAIDYVAYLFSKGDLEGNFEDAIQNTYFFVKEMDGKLSKNFMQYKIKIEKAVLQGFEKLNEKEKKGNQYLNYPKIETFEDVEEEVQNFDHEEYEKVIRNADIERVRNDVPADEQHVIERRFGFDIYRPTSIEKTAKEVNVTKNYAKNLKFTREKLKDY